jgi:sec-independent protein translocase protein TatA
MFGIGGGEFIFIIFIILMFFGSDKIPEMARTVGKAIAHLKNATNDIKSEIHSTAKDSGIDVNALTGGISNEIAKAKDGFSKMVLENESSEVIKSELDKVRGSFAMQNAAEVNQPEISPEVDSEKQGGPIKRQN